MEEELTETLKARLKFDMGSQGFPENGWDEIPLGKFYVKHGMNALIVIVRVLGEVLNNVLQPRGSMLTEEAWQDFTRGISLATLPKDAIENMLDAASTAIPIPKSMKLLSAQDAIRNYQKSKNKG